MKTNYLPSSVRTEISNAKQTEVSKQAKDNSLLIIALVLGSVTGIILTAVFVFGTNIY